MTICSMMKILMNKLELEYGRINCKTMLWSMNVK